MEELAKKILDYTNQATRLEQTRLALLDKIKEVMLSDIIPLISSYLLERYTIDEDKSRIYGVNTEHFIAHDSVPVAFQIDLRLLYDYKAILSDDDHLIQPIRDHLEQKLDELAKKYCLARINICGEPIAIEETH